MKKYIAMAAVAMMFAACTNDDMPEVPAVDKLTDTPITVNAGVGDLVTRAGMTTDDLADLGLTVQNPMAAKYCFYNVKFAKEASTGKFILASIDTPLWQNKTSKIWAWAYSPYNSNWYDLTTEQKIEVKTSQNVEADVKASDLLWAKGEVIPTATTQTGDIKYNNGTLDITLKHVFSKLTVNMRFGTELADASDVPESGLTLNNLNTKGTIQLVDAKIANLEGIEPITAYKNTSAPNGYNSSFEAILLPQTSNFMVEIKLDTRTFQWTPNSEFTFESGRSYTLNLIVGKDKVELADGGITVGEWQKGTEDDLVTE